MKILALDMTLCNTGYSVWGLRKRYMRKSCHWRWMPLTCGCIRPSSKKSKREYEMVSHIKRVQEITRELERLIETYDIKAIVVELLEGSQNSKAARTFGLVEGMLAVVLEKHQLPFYTYRAMAVKKTLTGRKTASKDSIIEAVKELFPLFFKKQKFRRSKSPRKGTLIWPSELEHIADSMGLIAHAEDQEDFRLLTQLAIETITHNGNTEEEIMEGIENDDFFD